jgi:hypothetical protein
MNTLIERRIRREFQANSIIQLAMMIEEQIRVASLLSWRLEDNSRWLLKGTVSRDLGIF